MKDFEILDKAADVIVERGWIQGEFYDLTARFDAQLPIEQCAVCARGAINVAAGYDPPGDRLRCDMREDALDALAFRLGYDPENYNSPADYVSRWNDNLFRTADEVVAELRACAAELKANAS